MEREEAGRAEQNMMHRPSLLRPHFNGISILSIYRIGDFKQKVENPPNQKRAPITAFQ
jgi:hypothetical protein